jgi:cysteine synthase
MIDAARGYKVIFTTPDSMSIERREMLASWPGSNSRRARRA